MSSISVLEWLSAVEDAGACNDNRPLKRPNPDLHPQTSKRQKVRRERDVSDTTSDNRDPTLSPRHPLAAPRRRTKSLSCIDMADRMDPPRTPTGSRKSMRRSASMEYSEKSASEIGTSRASIDGIKSASYRTWVLRKNGIYSKSPRDPLPVEVSQASQDNVIRRTPLTGGISTEDSVKFADMLFDKVECDEAAFIRMLTMERIFPYFNDWPELKVNEGLPFYKDSIPFCRGPAPSISGPKPDCAYGYADTAFDDLPARFEPARIFQPTLNLSWPFLIIEAKSQAMGNPLHHAENQCAGGGSVAVNSIATLVERYVIAKMRLSRQPNDAVEVSQLPSVFPSPDPSTPPHLLQLVEEPHPQATTDPPLQAKSPSTAELSIVSESIVYSLAVNTMMAKLYVHWRESPSTYFLQRIDLYIMEEPQDIMRLQTHLLNIVEWGMGERLRQVKMLIDFLLTHPDADPGYGDKKRALDDVDV